MTDNDVPGLKENSLPSERNRVAVIHQILMELGVVPRTPSEGWWEGFCSGAGKARDLLVNLITIFLVVVALYIIAQAVYREHARQMTIGDIVATKALAEDGVTTESLARGLKAAVDRAVADLDDYLLGEFREDFSRLRVSSLQEIRISESGFSTASIIGFFQNALPFGDGTVTGYLSGSGKDLHLTLRVRERVFEEDGTTIAELLDRAALDVVHLIKPATYVAILYRRGDPNALEEARTFASHYGLQLRECDAASSTCPDGDYAFANDIWGKILQDAGDYSGAIERYEVASALSKDRPWPEIHLGSALWNTAHYREAEEHFLSATARSPDDPDNRWAYFDLAQLRIAHPPKGASRDFDLVTLSYLWMAIAIARDHGAALPQAHLALALIYAKHGGSRAAIEEYRQASFFLADNLERLGRALSAHGEHDLAAAVNADLGKGYDERGDRGNAVNAYETAITECAKAQQCARGPYYHLLLGDAQRAGLRPKMAALAYATALHQYTANACGNSGPTSQVAVKIEHLGGRLLNLSQDVGKADRRAILRSACHAFGSAEAVRYYLTDTCNDKMSEIRDLASNGAECRAYLGQACAQTSSGASVTACEQLRTLGLIPSNGATASSQ